MKSRKIALSRTLKITNISWDIKFPWIELFPEKLERTIKNLDLNKTTNTAHVHIRGKTSSFLRTYYICLCNKLSTCAKTLIYLYLFTNTPELSATCLLENICCISCFSLAQPGQHLKTKQNQKNPPKPVWADKRHLLFTVQFIPPAYMLSIFLRALFLRWRCLSPDGQED